MLKSKPRENMKKIDKLKKRINNYLFDHFRLRTFLEHLRVLFICILSGIIFAFGYALFIQPGSDNSLTIVTGGVSGVSQNIVLILHNFCGVTNISKATFQSIFYFAINVPIMIFAFFCVGKRFAIYSTINVLISSLFIQIFPNIQFCKDVANLLSDELMTVAINPSGPYQYGGLILRLFFAAVCVGTASALAFRGGISCGGIDVFTYYFSLRKSTNVGRYSILLNGVIVFTYNLLLVINNHKNFPIAIISLLLAITYLFIASLVIDAINVRNKKVQIQIITSDARMSNILIANFPHSATVLNGQGAYTKSDRFVIYMIVSSSEVKQVVNVARKVDKNAFISIISLVQVYGNFYIRPIQ